MKIKLTYFKENGTYYAEGEYESEEKYPWEVFKEVRQMNKLPGLVGHWDGHILVETDYKFNVPQLIPRKS